MQQIEFELPFFEFAPSEGLPEILEADTVYVNSDTGEAWYLDEFGQTSLYTGPRPKKRK